MLGYTLAQFRGYVERAQARERRQQRERIEAAAFGFGGGAGLKAALQALQD